MGPGMRQVVGFGDRSRGRGTLGANLGRAIVQGPIARTCATAPRRGPLAKLLWADLLLLNTAWRLRLPLGRLAEASSTERV